MLELFLLLKEVLLLAGYFSDGKCFPRALTAAEEAKLLERLNCGDECARNELIERNLRLVAHIAKKYAGLMIDSDDVISIGTIGLIKAVNTFDQSKNIRLASYAARCIENEILMAARANKKRSADISLNEPLGTDKEGNEISLIDILDDGSENVIDEVEFGLEMQRVYGIINKVLTAREKTIVELRYGLNGKCSYAQREIAKMLQISRSYVSRIETRAIAKLAAELNRIK